MKKFLTNVVYYGENDLGGVVAVVVDLDDDTIYTVDDDKMNGFSIAMYESLEEFNKDYDSDNDMSIEVNNYFG